MKRELTVYYISRAVFSALFAGLMVWMGGFLWWHGLILGIVLYAGFLYYAHSGHYLIDPGRPLAPLHRDDRAKRIRDRALVLAAVVGGVSYALLSIAGMWLPLLADLAGTALIVGVLTYFGASQWMFARR
jgi:hypothetical protein